MMYKIPCILAALFLPLFLAAQTHTFSGCIKDLTSNDPLIGVNVLVKGTTTGTVTDFDGCFSLDYHAAEVTLVFTYTGYNSLEKVCKADEEITVKMDTDHLTLDEVVVTGLGRSKKRDRAARRAERRSEARPSAPGRVVSSEEIRSMPTRDISAVAATAAGLRSSDEGEAATIRGSRSDATEYYIDGVRVSPDEAAPPPPPSDDALPATYDEVEEDISPEEELPAAGQLTAGEVNDFGKWDLWHDVSQEDLAAYRNVWALYPDHRYGVQLSFPSGMAASDVRVRLLTNDGNLLWTGRTDNQGRAELWRGMFSADSDAQSRLQIVATIAGKDYILPTAHAIQEGLNEYTFPVACVENTAVDVAFVVDATGSMGDEIRYLSSELLDVMRRAADSLKGQDVRLGTVFYRDHSDSYLTRHLDFSAGTDSIVSFVRKQSAGGGGDTPEAVDDALEVALNQLKWRNEAAARLLFLVLDAPPHRTPAHVKRMQELTQLAAKKGVRIIPVVCSGMDQSGEYLLRSMALATNGTYTFLTDHSGIGGSHLEPSTDAYDVEKLNDLLVRIIHQYGKSSTCDVGPIASTPTKISETKEVDWTVFPNPTAGPTTLNLPKAEGAVFLLDAFGKVLKRYPVNQKRSEIQLGGLPSGTYFFRYTFEDNQSTQKVIVDRAR